MPACTPINGLIRNGEREFGVTVHRMEQKVDTGAIVGQLRFPIERLVTQACPSSAAA